MNKTQVKSVYIFSPYVDLQIDQLMIYIHMCMYVRIYIPIDRFQSGIFLSNYTYVRTYVVMILIKILKQNPLNVSLYLCVCM